MTETLEQLLRRYVDEGTYSFQDYSELAVDSVGRELETPLHVASLRGAADDVRLLLQGGADVHARTDIGVTALHRAVAGGNAQVIRMLLEAGADPDVSDQWGRTPLSMISELGRRSELLADVFSRSRKAGP